MSSHGMLLSTACPGRADPHRCGHIFILAPGGHKAPLRNATAQRHRQLTLGVSAQRSQQSFQRAAGQGRRRDNSAKTGRTRIPLSDVSVGQELEGTVRVVLESAVILKCRVETDAYLPEHLMGDFGPPSNLKKGDQLLTHVQRVDSGQEILRVTMLKGGKRMGGSPRKAVQDRLQPGQVVCGTVKKIVQAKDEDGWVRTTGVFVDIGAQTDAYLESGEGVPPTGKPVVVRILPDGLSNEQVKIRRRIGAVLDDSDQEPSGASAAALTAGMAAASLSTLDDTDDEDDEEEDDLYDKFGYLDDY